MTSSRDGVAIAYEIHGASESPTVVLVHGWAGNRAYWKHQVDFLVDRYRIITLDLGGHGESGAGRSDWNLVAFGDDVAAVVDDLGATKVALVGHSMGGDAIVYAAQLLGDRVNGLVWIDAFRSLGHERPTSSEEVDAFVAPFRANFSAAVHEFARNMFPATADEELVDRVATDMAGAPQEAALGSLGYAMNRQPRLLAAMTEITAPIVAINPDVAPTDAESLHKYGVEAIVLQNVGHFLMLEDPPQFNPVLATTLASFRW